MYIHQSKESIEEKMATKYFEKSKQGLYKYIFIYVYIYSAFQHKIEYNINTLRLMFQILS